MLWQVPEPAGKKKSKKQAEKYGGLESARPAPGRRAFSARYTTEPRKDDPKSLYAPMAAVPPTSPDALEMPVTAEDDYLLPQSGAAAAYVDVVPDNKRGISSSVLLLLLILMLLDTNSCFYCVFVVFTLDNMLYHVFLNQKLILYLYSMFSSCCFYCSSS